MGKSILNDSQELIEEFRKDFLENNCSVKDLCVKHSCSPAVIQRFLKKHGIKRVYKYNPSSEDILFIKNSIEEKRTYKSIAEELNVPSYLISSYVNRNIIRKKKWSNEIEDDSWINENNSLYWYVLGLLASDGHLGRFNEISFFQKDLSFIKKVQKWIHHNGVIYGKSIGVIHINSAFLHTKLIEKGFSSDKRYTIPFIKAPNSYLQWLFIRGLFDGDGSLYFKYISGVMEGLSWQICSGSENMTNGLYSFLNSEGIKCHKEKRKSSVGNTYYHIAVRSKEPIIKLFSLLYNNESIEYKLPKKYGKFLKLLELFKLNKQVDDIVDALRK